jgi:hypothetical protein
VSEEVPLCLLLLDGVLEEVPFGRRAEDLNRAPSVVVVEPGRRPPPRVMAARVARRLAGRRPGVPRVIVLVGDAQRELALALHGLHPGSELWIAGEDFDPGDPGDAAPFQLNDELWSRLEALGIARR